MVLPATMMPKVLLGRLSNPALEYQRILGDDAVDVGLAIAGFSNFDRLEAQLIASRGLTQCDAEHDRGAEPEGEYSRATRCFREAAEKGHPCRRESDRTLIEEERDGAAIAK